MADILVVDDEPNIRRMLSSLLVAEGHAAAQAATGEEALELLAQNTPDVVLLDLALPGADGLEVLAQIRNREPAVPVIMMSGRATLADAVRATKIGAFHFIEKPLSPEAVLLTVGSAVELRRARELSRTLLRELGAGERLVGSSSVMQQTRTLIEQVAMSDARVLITGESGTGKELAATALHELSGRASGPFVRVNSAAIPRELVESEMFGHERGSFTGAHERRLGKFELANGGTLFLDEVADLGMEAQSKLLRALESGEVERVGAQHPVVVDVRVVAATNRDLDAERGAGRFRDDLFYRLNVIRLHMPPLRERSEDIPELIDHFMMRLQRRHGLESPALEADALRRMCNYTWPGNVRELANVCERLAILHSGRSVSGRDIDKVLAPPSGGGDDNMAHLPFAVRLDAFERRLIDDAIADARGNIADAARRLDTDRANLYRRMRRLGMDR
ncbi:MAG TPA: sigma-54 dependent transcriptional regulator [Longimicrobiales bacterium]